jgi:hypothetical protein
MLRRHFAGAAIAACTISIFAVGCSTAAEDVGSSEAAATPANPSTPFALAESCVRMFKRHESVKEIDMEEGVIRWGCGDVPGVTNDDLGQEYCEYQAVQDGAIKKKPTEISPTGGPVSCVFTSVFTGAGQDTMLKAAMAAPENLGTPALSSQIVQMKKGFNSRGAATTLIRDCANASSSGLDGRLRVAACYQAYSKATGEAQAQLATVCKGNLTVQANWDQAVALGVKIAAANEEGFEQQRDISSCMAVRNAGLPWRNSDPMICSRTARSTNECGCKWNPVPSDLMGIPFVGWVDDQLPTGCRPAKVNGQDYPFITICEVTAQEIADLPLNPLYAGNIGNFCHDRFAMDLVMKLPLRTLQVSGSCQENPGFCDEYMGAPRPEPTEPTEPTTPTEPSTTEPTPTEPTPTTPTTPSPEPTTSGRSTDPFKK